LSDLLGQNEARGYYDKNPQGLPRSGKNSVAEARTWIASHANTQIEIAMPFTNAPWSFAISPNGKSLVSQVTKGGKFVTPACCVACDKDKECTAIPGTESTNYAAWH
jgi:hypothetical protein